MFRFFFWMKHTPLAGSGTFMLRNKDCSGFFWSQSVARVHKYVNQFVYSVRLGRFCEDLFFFFGLTPEVRRVFKMVLGQWALLQHIVHWIPAMQGTGHRPKAHKQELL